MADRDRNMITQDPLLIRHYSPFVNPVSIPSTDSITEMICVKIARAWLPVVRGALQTLIWEDVYQGTPAERQQATYEAIRLISYLCFEDRCMLKFRNSPLDPCIIQTSEDGGETWVDGWNMSACILPSSVRIYRFNITTNVYEVSIDNGVTWVDNSSEDPRFTQPQSPPPLAPDEVCKAAEQARDNIKQWMTDLWELLQASSAVAAIVAIVLAYFGQFYAWVALLGNPTVWALATALLGLIGLSFEAAFPEAFWDDFLCYLYLAFQAAEFEDEQWVSFAVWNTLQARLQEDGSPPAIVIAFMIAMGGPKWLSDMASYGESEGTACTDCEEWVHAFLYDQPAPPTYTIVYGALEEGEVNRFVSNTAYGLYQPPPLAQITQTTQVTFDTAHITRMQFRFSCVVNNPVNVRNYAVIAYSTQHPEGEYLIQDEWTVSGHRYHDTGFIDRDINRVDVIITSRCQGNPNDRNEWYSWIVQGDGADPFN